MFATLVHQALSGYAANFVADDCCFITNARPRSLRSAETRTLLVSRPRTNIGDTAFSAAGPRVWNYLPTKLKQPFQTVAVDIFIRSLGPKRSVLALRFGNPPTYVLSYSLVNVHALCWCAVQLCRDADPPGNPHHRILSQLHLTHSLLSSTVGAQSRTRRSGCSTLLFYRL